MSALSVQVRDLTTQLAARTEELETAQAELAKLQEASADVETLNAEHAKAIEDLKAEHEEALGNVQAELDESKAEATQAQDELEAVQGELDAAQAQLEDPAFKDAAAEGQDAEPIAENDGPSLEEFKSLKGKEQFAYFQKHGDKLV